MRRPMSEQVLRVESLPKKRSFWHYFARNKALYVMLIPGLLNLLLFKYLPMWGIVISFQQFHPAMGIAGSRWVGVKHFVDFFTDPYFYRIIRNTLLLGVYVIIFSFPALISKISPSFNYSCIIEFASSSAAPLFGEIAQFLLNYLKVPPSY